MGRVVNTGNVIPTWKSGKRFGLFTPNIEDVAVSKNGYRLNSNILIPQVISY